jgi:hypothetical protein
MMPAMTEPTWKRLLNLIGDGLVVPVLGPRLLLQGDEFLQRRLAKRLLSQYKPEVREDDLPTFNELEWAITQLGSEVNPQDLYSDIHDALQEFTREETSVPVAIAQLAAISDFRLYVTLTPDDLLIRALRQRRAANEIVHSPKLPSSEFRDLPSNWNNRAGEAQVLYLFGKSRPAPMFAIHDEDLLEYAHNLIARGSQVPNSFLGELQERSLLFIGCDYPDWLSRFFLRLTNKVRLSDPRRREWLVLPEPSEASLTAFLRHFSKDTEVLGQQSPENFVAELHHRWITQHGDQMPTPPTDEQEKVPQGALFFISYSRATDLQRAEVLYKSLLSLGAAESEIWFDRKTIEPGEDFQISILGGIAGCRYFLPLLSLGANRREEAFVFREWGKANERLGGMNREFVVPIIVDADYSPERYTVPQVQDWSNIQFGHAPDGVPNSSTKEKLTALIRAERRRRL